MTEATNAVTDVVELLQRRSRLLEHLRDEPGEKRELVEHLDVPRSTLDRAVRELESAEIVEYVDGAYQLTPVGDRLVREYVAFVERTATTVELEPLLRWVPRDEFAVDLRWLAEAALWTPEPNDPWAMVNRHVDALESADDVRAILPLVGLHAFEMVHRRVLDDGAQFRSVVEPGVAETFRTDESYAPLFRDLRPADGFGFAVYPGTIPYFVGVFDDEFVQIGVDEDSEPRALLETDHPAMLEWARETIAEYERQAEPVDAGDPTRSDA